MSLRSTNKLTYSIVQWTVRNTRGFLWVRFSYVKLTLNYIIVLFVETPREFITAIQHWIDKRWPLMHLRDNSLELIELSSKNKISLG